MLNAISLFCSSGIGDLGLHANSIKTVAACEIKPERMQLFSANNPGCKCFCGDIWELQNDIIEYYKVNYTEPPFLILATPPCQGMSQNGMGKMLSDYRKGLRPKYDERNRLIIPAIKIIKELHPQWVIFENVSNMVNTLIYDEGDQLINIIDYIHRELGGNYVGEPQTIDCADYGVPEHRIRLLTVLSSTKNGRSYFSEHHSFLRVITHNHQDKKIEKTRQSPQKQALVTKLNIQKKARLDNRAFFFAQRRCREWQRPAYRIIFMEMRQSSLFIFASLVCLSQTPASSTCPQTPNCCMVCC